MSELKTGIYEIKNVVNDKRYIGSAALSFKRRWNLHKYNLRKNFHHSPYLQNSWNKHGEKNFEFNILELVEDKTKCIEREQYWIDFHNAADVEFGYNICPTAGSQLGLKRTEETKSKMSKVHLGNQNWLGKTHTEETKSKISLAKLGKTHTEESRSKISKGHCKYIYQITKPNKDEIIVSNLNEFCKNNGLDNSHMCAVANGKRRQHKGYIVQILNKLGE